MTVLEARERVGGRAWSTTMGNGVPVERGGEFIFDGYDELFRLVDELGLELVKRGFTYGLRRPVGPGLGTRDAMRPTAAAMAEVRAARAADGRTGSIADVFAATPISEADRALLTARFTIGLGWRLDEVSERWPAPQLSADGHSEFAVPYWIRGGNQGLADAIARELNGELRLRGAALAVEQDDAGVTVHVADGTQVRGDAVSRRRAGARSCGGCASPRAARRHRRHLRAHRHGGHHQAPRRASTSVSRPTRSRPARCRSGPTRRARTTDVPRSPRPRRAAPGTAPRWRSTAAIQRLTAPA